MLGDDHLGAACIEIGDQGIAVERRVADQRPKGEPVDERRHAHRVEALPRQKHEAHKGAERVGERQDRGGQAAFGTANGLARSPPLYEVPCVKRYLLRANAVCWTKSGSASRLSGRRLAAPPCIRSALAGDLTTIPRAWANARPGEPDPSLQRHFGPWGTPVHARPASSRAASGRRSEPGQTFSTAPSGTIPTVT